ncbi:MAG: penicillin-binding protein 2 [Xanthomonadaceae bacterium]|nr:penicillin-binding protein 2 [Xanthomonadaceae bacterium]
MAKTWLTNPQAERALFLGRALFAVVVVLVLTGGLVAQLVALQVGQHAHYATLSDGNRMRIEPLAPTRGLIFDRNGVLLAGNEPSFTLEIVPEQVTDIPATLAALGELIEIREQDLARFNRQLLRQRRFHAVPVRFQLSDEEASAFAVNRHLFPGVDIRATLARRYPFGAIGVHAIGYMSAISEADLAQVDAARYSGTTHYGKSGVELAYESVLHGAVGFRQVETNVQGRVLRVVEYSPPTPGNDLHLTLDIEVQLAAERALGDRAGAIVALDPRNGDVLALVSRPGFDPNAFVDGIDATAYGALERNPRRPLFNRALRGRYPPGSTVKPVLALAADAFRTELARRSVWCEGYFQLPGIDRRFRDWRREGHGRVDLHRAVVESCDVYFYELSLELGIDRMHEFLTAAGFGVRTGIDLKGELAGLMPSREWKRNTMNQGWFHGETLIVGIGQGYMLSTPMQLAQTAALFANRGHAYRPRIVAPIDAAPERVAPLIPERVGDWRRTIQGMTDVVHGAAGTARAIAPRGEGAYTIAGKTGTAQVFTLAQDDDRSVDRPQLPEHLRDHALFIAFAPVESPRIAIAVIVEHGGGGSDIAAPVARTVLDAWIKRGQP